jgi:hypothetical protein
MFIILVLVVGQIDANIIEPKILGDRTGVSSLCVIVAISVMGNLWGVFGMIIGVPLFAVVVTLVDDFANAKLAKKGLSDDLDDYYDDDDEFDYEDDPKIALSKRYYLDRLLFVIKPKSKRGQKPVRNDYLIYPPEWQENEELDESSEGEDTESSIAPAVSDEFSDEAADENTTEQEQDDPCNGERQESLPADSDEDPAITNEVPAVQAVDGEPRATDAEDAEDAEEAVEQEDV